MDLDVAVEAVKFWLHRLQGTFLFRSIQELEQGYRIAVQQLTPQQRYRTFDVLPEEVADCWKVVEAS